METTVDVKDIRPGYKLLEPVQKDETILFESGYELTSEDIVLLKLWRINSVTVEVESPGRSVA